MKEMKVLGLSLKDYSVKEAMKMVDGFLKTAKVDTVSFLSMDNLMEAVNDSEYKTWLEEMDLLVPISKEILTAASITSRHRLREVEDNKFVKEFGEKLSREKRSVFILGEKEEDIIQLKDHLENVSKGIKVVGTFVIEDEINDDKVVNEINFLFPDVVLSVISKKKQERFVYTNKDNINARLFVSINKLIDNNTNCHGFSKFFNEIEKTIFRRKVIKYENSQEK